MLPLLDHFGEGTEPADSGTFFIIYADNYKPRSEGTPGHGLKVRYGSKANLRGMARYETISPYVKRVYADLSCYVAGSNSALNAG